MTRSSAVFFSSSNFGSRNRTKKGKEFPEVTGQVLKEKRKRNTRCREDVCKHVRKRPPEVELTGLGCWEMRTGDLQYDYSSCWDEGAGEGEGGGIPQQRAGGAPTDHPLGCSSVDRAPDAHDILASIPSFSKSRSVDSRLTLKLSVLLSLLQAPHNYTSLPSCVFPALSQLQ